MSAGAGRRLRRPIIIVSAWSVCTTRLLTGAVLVVDASVSPGAAEAGTLQVVTASTPAPRNRKYRRLEYRAAPGEANQFELSFDGVTVVGVDRAGIDPGPGCERNSEAGPSTVRCPFRVSDVNFAVLKVAVGDQDDTVEVRTDLETRPLGGSLFGGPGNDVLRSEMEQATSGAGTGTTAS